MTANGWASPSGSQDDADWRRPVAPAGRPARPNPGEMGGGPAGQRYVGPPAMRQPSVEVGWGPLITPGPVPRSLPPQDHEALDQEEARARGVTVGIGVLTLAVLLLLLLLVVIRAGTATANL